MRLALVTMTLLVACKQEPAPPAARVEAAARPEPRPAAPPTDKAALLDKLMSWTWFLIEEGPRGWSAPCAFEHVRFEQDRALCGDRVAERICLTWTAATAEARKLRLGEATVRFWREADVIDVALPGQPKRSYAPAPAVLEAYAPRDGCGKNDAARGVRLCRQPSGPEATLSLDALLKDDGTIAGTGSTSGATGLYAFAGGTWKAEDRIDIALRFEGASAGGASPPRLARTYRSLAALLVDFPGPCAPTPAKGP